MRFRQFIVVAGLILPGAVAMAQVEMRKELIVGDTALTPAQERGLRQKDSFRECENCPEMVVVPAGGFTMGSPAGEKDRWPTGSFTIGSPTGEKDRDKDEGPQHVVTIGRPIAVGKLHVTVAEFDAFVRATGYQASATCKTHEGVRSEERADLSWRNPGFLQESTHPVVCVSWDDANAYANWLTKKTGKPYRLLSEAEWEYAARGRTTPGAYPRFWFGDDATDLCRYANGVDRLVAAPCADGYAFTSPAGHYEPNAFGLYDMAGNASQLTADCFNWRNYDGAPSDGSVWMAADCKSGHVGRGGSWRYLRGSLRAAFRDNIAGAHNIAGFRVGRTLTP